MMLACKCRRGKPKKDKVRNRKPQHSTSVGDRKNFKTVLYDYQYYFVLPCTLTSLASYCCDPTAGLSKSKHIMDLPRVSHQTGRKHHYFLYLFSSFQFFSFLFPTGKGGRGAYREKDPVEDPERSTWSGLTDYHRRPQKGYTMWERARELSSKAARWLIGDYMKLLVC